MVGEAHVSVAYGEQHVEERLILVQDGNHALFGLNWLRQLKLNWPSLLHVDTVTQSTTDFVAQFPAVFKNDLGIVKDHEAEITLINDAKPKYCSARPVPYAIRSVVDTELDRLEQEGIIKPVESAI